MENQPLHNVEWVDPNTLMANGYNPNRVFELELDLLKLSIMEDGWTQPIVARDDGEIVDGFHRWTLGKTDPDIQALTQGLVPIVRIRPSTLAHQRASTIRHNRARGVHGILKMGDVIQGMLDEGMEKADILLHLGMENEEFIRLTALQGQPADIGKDSYGKGWVPTTTKG